MLPGIKSSRTNTNAVRAVAYMLAEVDLEVKAKVTAKLIGNQREAAQAGAAKVTEEARARIGEVAAALKDQVGGVMKELEEGIKEATRGMSDLTDKLTASATRYRNAVAGPAPQQQAQGDGPYLRQFNPRLKARQGLRSRQVLIDIDDAEELAVFRRESIMWIKDKVDKALAESKGALEGHKFKLVMHLRNGGSFSS